LDSQAKSDGRIEIDDVTIEGGGYSRFSPVSNASEKSKMKDRDIMEEVGELDLNVVLETSSVVNLRKDLENFLYNESNKVNKIAIKYILSKWSELEEKVYKVKLNNQRIRGRLEELSTMKGVTSIRN